MHTVHQYSVTVQRQYWRRATLKFTLILKQVAFRSKIFVVIWIREHIGTRENSRKLLPREIHRLYSIQSPISYIKRFPSPQPVPAFSLAGSTGLEICTGDRTSSGQGAGRDNVDLTQAPSSRGTQPCSYVYTALGRLYIIASRLSGRTGERAR